MDRDFDVILIDGFRIGNATNRRSIGAIFLMGFLGLVVGFGFLCFGIQFGEGAVGVHLHDGGFFGYVATFEGANLGISGVSQLMEERVTIAYEICAFCGGDWLEEIEIAVAVVVWTDEIHILQYAVSIISLCLFT